MTTVAPEKKRSSKTDMTTVTLDDLGVDPPRDLLIDDAKHQPRYFGDVEPGTKLRIREMVLSRGYSIRRLSRVCNISSDNLTRLVNGDTNMMHILNLDKIAWALGCKVGDFFVGEPNPPVGGILELALPGHSKNMPKGREVKN